jgi:hypothetical protein
MATVRRREFRNAELETVNSRVKIAAITFDLTASGNGDKLAEFKIDGVDQGWDLGCEVYGRRKACGYGEEGEGVADRYVTPRHEKHVPKLDVQAY